MRYAKLLFTFVCAAAVGLYSCTAPDEPKIDEPQPQPVAEDPYLRVSQTEIDADEDGARFYLTVESNRTVEVASQDEWCEAALLDDTLDNNLKITVAANEGEARTTEITLSAADCEPIVIGVEQEEREEGPYLIVADTAFEAEAAGGSFTTTVVSNRDITLGGSTDWCSIELLADAKKDNLRITVAPNNSAVRQCTITLSAPECKTKEIVIRQERVKKTTCELLSFKIERALNPNLRTDIEFDFDTQARTLTAMYLKWIEGDAPQMMVATFEHNGDYVSVNGSAIASGMTAISFADDLQIVVTAENGDSQTYSLSLNCPQINTELPVLRMQPDYEITSKEVYVPTAIELYSPHTTEGWWNSASQGKIEMRGRGNSTWGLPKKPYRMKFPEKFSPIGLNHTSAKSWVLLANDMDKSLLRDHIGFAMSRDMFNAADGWHDPQAVLFTPCSQHINVYKGDDYLGLYLLTDQMERAKGRIAVDKLEASDGDDPAKITGGHIIETDLHEGTFHSSHGIKMSHKYPDDDDCTPAQYRYMENFINQAEAVLYGSNYKDPVNGWRRYFDEKTLADFIIVKELCGDMDGYTSTYFYKRRGVDKIFFGPVWDVDKGWDNDRRVPHYDYQPLSSLMIYAGFYMPSYVNPDWMHRFWKDESFRKFVAARWAAKKEQLLATIYRELDTMPEAMHKAIEANYTVWEFYYQYSNEAKMPARTYPLEIERMRSLTQDRAALLDRLFNE